MKHPLGTQLEVITQVTDFGPDHPASGPNILVLPLEILKGFILSRLYQTASFRHPGTGRAIRHLYLHGLEYRYKKGPVPDLALGDAIRVIYILEQTTGQARWRWTWEPVGFEHSDLYGFGDDSYEF